MSDQLLLILVGESSVRLDGYGKKLEQDEYRVAWADSVDFLGPLLGERSADLVVLVDPTAGDVARLWRW